MSLSESIDYIKKAKDKNKLVIFVGAGVSRNSGLPDWSELVLQLAKEINYPVKKDENGKKFMDSNEFLKIPQYYLKLHGQKNYFDKIKSILDVDCEPNIVDYLIYRLNPKHIITTNYDRLLEKTQLPERILFDVVTKDKDIIESKKNKFIIKMHGDIKDVDNIVLCEDDYLNYTQNHILIETYIKSLLMTNTFLFIGYSLNDYNLKLIMSWVDMLSCNVDKNKRPKHFLIQEINNSKQSYIEKYYKDKNIYIVDPNEVSSIYNFKLDNNNLSDIGKRLCNTLDYIRKYPLNLKDKLFIEYKCFINRNYVPLSDLFQANELRNIKIMNRKLVFDISNSNNKELAEIVKSTDVKSQFIKKVLIKADVKEICILEDFSQKECINLSRYVTKNELIEKLIKLEENCNYIAIQKLIPRISNNLIKAYYYFILFDYENAINYLSIFQKDSIVQYDTYDLVMQKLNLGWLKQLSWQSYNTEFEDVDYILKEISESNRCDLKYLSALYEGNIIEISKMKKIKDEFIRVFLKEDDSLYIGNVKENLFKLRNMAYNYYKYIKKNYIMIDHFSNPDEFFYSYIESILATYSCKKDRVIDLWITDRNDYSSYILNIFDINILIKYCKYEDLIRCFEVYNIDMLEIDSKVDLESIGINLCIWLSNKVIDKYVMYLKNYILIIAHSNIIHFNKFPSCLEKVLIMNEHTINNYILGEIGEALLFLLERKDSIISGGYLDNFIQSIFMLKFDISKSKGICKKIIKLLNLNVVERYGELIDIILKSGDINKLGLIDDILNKDQKSKYKECIKVNINKLTIKNIVVNIIKDRLDYDLYVENLFINEIDNIVDYKKRHPGEYEFPDKLEDALSGIVVLFLCNKGVDLNKFKKYKEYYEPLFFLVDPYNFDYSKMKIDNYNWKNILRKEEYLKIIAEHGKKEVGEKMLFNIENGLSDNEQRRIYYKYFDEIQE